MKVTLIDHMGTDLSVVNAARVSFAKKSEGDLDWVPISPDHSKAIRVPTEADKRLIRFLARENHWTPFGHTAITLHIKAPIFVARQLGKHQVGFVWNEVSRRYVTDEPEFYEPEYWRKAADNVKQGSSDEVVKYNEDWDYTYDLRMTYLRMITSGVCPEQARMVLPQSMYTEWYWTGNLYSFANVFTQRTDSHTQKETQEVAKQIGDIIKPLFPVSWEALTT